MSDTKREPLSEQHMLHVLRSINSDCWIWNGQRTYEGYGVLNVPGEGGVRAHRYFYRAFIGPIPDGLVIDHLCGVKRCVNPDHLNPTTNRLNVLSGNGPIQTNARKTHCLRGHLLAGENIRIVKRRISTKRECKTCKSTAYRAVARAWQVANRERTNICQRMRRAARIVEVED